MKNNLGVLELVFLILSFLVSGAETMCPSGSGNWLEIHWALLAGVRASPLLKMNMSSRVHIVLWLGRRVVAATTQVRLLVWTFSFRATNS